MAFASANSSAPPDSALLEQFVRGNDAEAFSALVKRYARLVTSVCRTILHRREDVEDASQATFLTLSRKAQSLIGHSSLAGWLHQVAWNISMRARQARSLRNAREASAFPEIPARPDAGLDQAEIVAALHEAIAEMPEKYRMPFVLHHLEGWSEPEIAALLHAKVGTVSGQLSRGRRMLRDRLANRGYMTAAAMIGAGGMAASPRADVDAATITRLTNINASTVRPAVAALASRANAGATKHAALWIASIAVLGFALIAGAILARMFWTNESTPRPQQSLTQSSGWIRGSVIGPSGGPVTGATVYAYLSAEDSAARRNRAALTTTGDDGAFEFTQLPQSAEFFLVVGIPTREPVAADQFKFSAESSGSVVHEIVVIRR